jgi:hypothetical protein
LIAVTEIACVVQSRVKVAQSSAQNGSIVAIGRAKLIEAFANKVAT